MKTFFAFALLAVSAQSFAAFKCTIQTYNGRYLTAVGGGGRTTDVIHSDATVARSWETFRLVDSRDGSSPVKYGIKTKKGTYLTAVGGGGRITDTIHSDSRRIKAWEKFQLFSLGGGYYNIKTNTGNYVTAVDGGGRITDVIHTDATVASTWERFKVTCTSPIDGEEIPYYPE